MQEETVPRKNSPRGAKTAQELRLDEAREKGVPWKLWGPYLSARQWGTVREDSSEKGDASNNLTTTRPDRVPITGAKRDSPALGTTISGCVLPSLSGTARTQSSRSGSLA